MVDYDIENYNEDIETRIQERVGKITTDQQSDEADLLKLRLLRTKGKIRKYISEQNEKRKLSSQKSITTEDLTNKLKLPITLIISAIEESEKGPDCFGIFRARDPAGKIIYTLERGIYQGFSKVDLKDINYTGTFGNFMKNNGKKL